MQRVTERDWSGEVNSAPWALRAWQSNSVLEMKSQYAGELPLPCPVP
jgi:hypothetical protein